MINSYSVFLPYKICEELSAKQMLESQQILSLQNRQVESRSGQFVKDFSATTKSIFSFFAVAHNDKGYGRGRHAGVQFVALR